jgi:hypothetical protein
VYVHGDNGGISFSVVLARFHRLSKLRLKFRGEITSASEISEASLEDALLISCIFKSTIRKISRKAANAHLHRT